ncbi:hypothetical protein U1Q18_006361 [Sarracenia purpurea var. burkii]
MRFTVLLLQSLLAEARLVRRTNSVILSADFPLCYTPDPTLGDACNSGEKPLPTLAAPKSSETCRHCSGIFFFSKNTEEKTSSSHRQPNHDSAGLLACADLQLRRLLRLYLLRSTAKRL